jgi:hypothetical protein
MDIYVPRIVDESPASDLEPRGGGEEWHGGKQKRVGDMSHAEKLLSGSALLLPSSPLKTALI